jgi:hypothetical protein
MSEETNLSRKPKLLEAGHPDNFQTPATALDCLVPYLRRDWMVWEPACGGVNFLEADAGRYDCIVTNPPFSIKEKFLARCYALAKPFALLLPITTFDSSARRKLFHTHGVQVVMPNGRVNFETPNGVGSSAWFYCCWFTWGLELPSQLMFAGIGDNLL